MAVVEVRRRAEGKDADMNEAELMGVATVFEKADQSPCRIPVSAFFVDKRLRAQRWKEQMVAGRPEYDA